MLTGLFHALSQFMLKSSALQILRASHYNPIAAATLYDGKNFAQNSVARNLCRKIYEYVFSQLKVKSLSPTYNL